jgi:hypothetical protein
MSDFLEHMQINPATKVNIAIPNWHINNGHGQKCRSDFCLIYTKGAGRTCVEEVEMTWSLTNSLVTIVREMAPGARHDTLNDHLNGWNFCKSGWLSIGKVILLHQIHTMNQNKSKLLSFNIFG